LKIRRIAAITVYLARSLGVLYAQTPDSVVRLPAPGAPAPAAPIATQPNSEQEELNRVMNEAGNSPVDIIRGLEAYLKNHPDTKQRPAIERTLTKASMDANDRDRIVLYGEKLLITAPDDIQLLDRVMKELTEKGDAQSAKRALEYGKRYEAAVGTVRKQPPQGHLTPGQWSQQLDRATARIYALEAQAFGNAGYPKEAVGTAAQSWAMYPTGEAVRVAAAWLVKLGRTKEAIEKYADAFTLEDPASVESDRARDRTRMGELYTKLNGSEKGLGDIILEAYDRTSAIMHERMESLRLKDPNAQAADIFDFTLPPAGGADQGAEPLVMATLKGKTVVLDFWATWCVPCRAQHPLIEKVREHFAKDPDVFFVAVDTDDDPSLVEPFLMQQGWENPTWLEGGLERKLSISSIPTTIVLDPAGRISSRMAGLIPDRFEEMLTQRIEEARQSK
jgi:thiol-disulfide isomerase/thioredoxin